MLMEMWKGLNSSRAAGTIRCDNAGVEFKGRSIQSLSQSSFCERSNKRKI